MVPSAFNASVICSLRPTVILPRACKRGSVRVIYTVRLISGALVLLVIYSKDAQDTISPQTLRKIAEEKVMPRSDKEPKAWDPRRDIGKELLEAIRDVKAGRHGAHAPKVLRKMPSNE
jgi:hypothetical protein